MKEHIPTTVKKYSNKIDYDQYSMKINGQRVFLFGGEFHYFRIPDRERWQDILSSYKIGGLNCIRIYFHWGFHSPDEGKYIFTGNRDLDYLFTLCEEIGLYVLAAPGPYLCAETSAGGYPTWLIAKRDVRIHHLKRTGFKKYDPKFAEYSKQWYAQFIPIMVKHELTTNPNGCVIGLQLENELMRKKIITLGLDKEIEDLALYAREFGATVPFFHNDPFPTGAWVGTKDSNSFAVDLYGFDKYVIFCPSKYNKANPPHWSSALFKNGIDHTEKTVRGFGGRAIESPIFLPELQGGWFNQWGLDHTFDEIYTYYGSTYQKMLVESFMAQGMTMFSMYMYYGGTNWGTLGDPDVYTSYDYSACIREFGYLSDRLRMLRLTKYFIDSFPELLQSNAVEIDIQSNLSDFIAKQRRGEKGVNFYFFRNLNSSKKLTAELTHPDASHVNLPLNYRSSFIGVGNYKIPGFNLLLSSIPWLAKVPFEDGELWIFQMNDGELVFEGIDFTTFEEIFATTKGQITRAKFKKPGSARLRSVKNENLYFLILSEADALTLAIDRNEKSWQIAWGAYGLHFNNGTLAIEITKTQTVKYLGPSKLPEFTSANDPILKQLKQKSFEPAKNSTQEFIPLKDWAKHPIRWDAPELEPFWKNIDLKSQRNPLDHYFTHGHVFYRCIFTPTTSDLNLKLNIRHRGIIWMNGQYVGGKINYSMIPGLAGAENGPDPSFAGSVKYDLSSFIKAGEVQTMIIAVESLGQNRTPLVLNDVRNPRGILQANFSAPVEKEQWAISGIDVRTQDCVFNTGGLLGEQLDLMHGKTNEWIAMEQAPNPKPDDKLIWYKTTFNWQRDPKCREPLRIHIEGKLCAHFFLNGTYIGRYWGDFGPQHDFYLMDNLIQNGENLLVMAIYTMYETNMKLELLPYIIEEASGNLTEKGFPFKTYKYEIQL